MTVGLAGRSNGRAAASVVPLAIAPGRLIVRVTALRDQPLVASRLEDRVAGDGAVRQVRTSVVPRSLLVFFGWEPGALVGHPARSSAPEAARPQDTVGG